MQRGNVQANFDSQNVIKSQGLICFRFGKMEEIALQCLKLTQLLVGGSFKLSLKFENFSYSASSSTVPKTVKESMTKRKRKSPSTKRRNKKRKDEFITKKKLESTTILESAFHHSTFHGIPVNNMTQLGGTS